MKFDYLIVGAGFTGATLAERLASQYDKKVLVIDRRNHIGGNAFDRHNEDDILLHLYGPHIFHTNSKKVWEYLSQFTEWRPYFHEVLGVIDGQKVPIPFNLNSLYALFPPAYAERLENLLIESFGFGVKVPILKLRESSSSELKFLAEYIYKNVFLNYTKSSGVFRLRILIQASRAECLFILVVTIDTFRTHIRPCRAKGIQECLKICFSILILK